MVPKVDTELSISVAFFRVSVSRMQHIGAVVLESFSPKVLLFVGEVIAHL